MKEPDTDVELDPAAVWGAQACIYSSLETWVRSSSSPKQSWRQLVAFPISLLGREGSVAVWCGMPTSHHVHMCRWKDLELASEKGAEKESVCRIRRKEPREGPSHCSTLVAASQRLLRKPESCGRWFLFPQLLSLARSSKLPLTSGHIPAGGVASTSPAFFLQPQFTRLSFLLHFPAHSLSLVNPLLINVQVTQYLFSYIS